MARIGEIPHTPYFGTVDATPLFVLLFAETAAWTGDERLYRDLLPSVRRALEWIERYGDLDGDGFVEYLATPPDGVHITHQGWKDSHDSLHHVDGRPAHGAIALVEVQGYVYAAYRRLAEVVATMGDTTWATELLERAEAMRARVEAAFWLDSQRFYAQALDGDKSPVGAISSNPGHLLFCGLPSPERADAVAQRLAQPDIDSGWGVRTLASSAATYNPMSYHNGSVWPHDNSLIAAGLARYGLTDASHRILSALLRAAAAYPLNRLPELYCGFARQSDAASDAPVAYPVSCSPQAWASGAALLLIKAILGLELDLERRALTVRPDFPSWLTEIDVHGLLVRGVPAAISVRREDNEYRLTSTGPVTRR
jgi:glycogen debranching enzyme